MDDFGYYYLNLQLCFIGSSFLLGTGQVMPTACILTIWKRRIVTSQ